MARQTKREKRKRARAQDTAVKLMGLGLGFLIVPLFMGKSPIGQAFVGLRWPGILLMVAGALVLWISKKSSESGSEPMAMPYRPARPAGRFRAPANDPSDADRIDPHMSEAAAANDAKPTFGRAAANEPQPRPDAWGPKVFELIEWRRFEAVVERLFQQAGFETKSKSHGADGGIDVWLYSRHHDDGPVSVVQCKHWQGKQVGVDKIRELRGVMAAQGVARGQYATTSTYSTAAQEFAKGNSINLLDVNGLLGLIAKRTPEQQAELLNVALEGDYWRPTCVNCGVKMVERRPRNGGNAFWGCANFPACKTVMQMGRP